jgi:SP family general alpha glucoside:H+ symporter-like MFS transporter
MATCMTNMLVIGILNTKAYGKHAIGLAQAILTLFWTFMFQLSMGRMGWAIPAGVGSTR